MIVAVDFDNTLALGNFPHIHMLRPNEALIGRVREAHSLGATIVLVTARGEKDGLSEAEKEKKYFVQIRDWLKTHGVPFDKISFKKEYANLYIDDQSIRPDDVFLAKKSEFTQNVVILTDSTAIKSSKTAPFENAWYTAAKMLWFQVPNVLFCNDSCIITERVYHDGFAPTADDFIDLINRMKIRPPLYENDFDSYLKNLPNDLNGLSENTKRVIDELPKLKHGSTFFHGDLSTTNVLIASLGPVLIDPNCKHVFGSYLTDAGKAAFSLIAYEARFDEAQKIVDVFGPQVWHFAVAEGLRVCKYRPEYISIVNNISDLI